MAVTTHNTSPAKVADTGARNAESNRASITVSQQVQKFVEDMDNEIKAASYWQYYCTIDRVPTSVRELKPDAYTPQCIAIGPLHRNLIHLKSAEQQKLKLVKDFLGEAYEETALLADYFELMKVLEKEVRQCYSDDIQIKGADEFLRMMLVDACFILQLIHKWRDYTAVSGKDDFFTKNRMQHIVRDLILVENQLPFFVLEKLSSRNSRYSKPHVLYEDTRCFLENFLKPLQKSSSSSSSMVLPYFTVWHLLDYARYLAVSPPYASEKDFKRIRCATELNKAAAVKFKRSPTGYFTDISFDRKEGVLRIPPIDINDHSTELLLRNLIALEQSHKFKKKYVTAYVVFMKNLINSAEDVELLQDVTQKRKKKESNLEEKMIFGEKKIKPLEVVALFKDVLAKVTLPDDDEIYFSHVYLELENHYDDPSFRCRRIQHHIVSKAHRYCTLLKTKYFDSPWSFVTFLAATAILVLTALQTYASLKGVKT